MAKPKLRLLTLTAIGFVGLFCSCIPVTEEASRLEVFESQQTESVLILVVDSTGSFSTQWEARAFSHFVEVSDRFFHQAIGKKCRLIVSQIGGNKTIVFDGDPTDLQKRFSSAEDFKKQIQANSVGASNVYAAIRDTTAYVNALDGLSDRARKLMVIFSDTVDTSDDQSERREKGGKMLEQLSEYRAKGGAVGLYFVVPSEVDRWKKIRERAGFDEKRMLIVNDSMDSIPLPNFE